MGKRLVIAAVAILVAVNIGLSYAVLRRNASAPSPQVSAPAVSGTASPSRPATRAASPSPRATRPSPTVSTTPTRAPTRVPTRPASPLISAITAIPSTASAPSPAATATPSPARGGIEIAPTSYVAAPFETVRITGRYPGVPAGTTLRVEHLDSGTWLRFPLPTTTAASGQFAAYVELGEPGRYRVRVVDATRAVTSPAITVDIG
jgi:hypothetical protein